MNNNDENELREIANILRERLNPPKKPNIKITIAYIIFGFVVIWVLYKVYMMLSPYFNYQY